MLPTSVLGDTSTQANPLLMLTYMRLPELSFVLATFKFSLIYSLLLNQEKKESRLIFSNQMSPKGVITRPLT